MSGHSKWSTIKRQKGFKDVERGKLFSKLSRMISIAVKSGGSDPESNYKLRIAIDKARTSNMPRDKIDNAIARGSKEGEDLEEVIYEGVGPSGISIVIEAATDKRNRTSQEIKNIFERGGGTLSGPGSVMYNFESKGLLVVKAQKENIQEQMLKLIDLGVEEMDETADGIEVYTHPDKLSAMKKTLEDASFSIISAELILAPRNYQTIDDPKLAARVLNFLDSLNNHEDVQKVFANVDIPDKVLEETKNQKE